MTFAPSMGPLGVSGRAENYAAVVYRFNNEKAARRAARGSPLCQATLMERAAHVENLKEQVGE